MLDKVCFECGGSLELKGGENRIFTYRKGIDYVLPSDFLLETCTSCGCEFIDEQTEKKIKDSIESKG